MVNILRAWLKSVQGMPKQGASLAGLAPLTDSHDFRRHP